MKKTFLKFFGRANISLVLVLVISTFWSQGLWANISGMSLVQSPKNNVPIGKKITYTVKVSNSETSLIYPDIVIRSGNLNVSKKFTSESGGCGLDGGKNGDAFFCGGLKKDATYTFSLTESKAVTFPLEFTVSCVGDNSCFGDTKSIETIVGEPEPKPVTGNIVFDSKSYTVNEDAGTVTGSTPALATAFSGSFSP